MLRRLRLIGGMGIVCVSVGLLIAHSGTVSGDTAAPMLPPPDTSDDSAPGFGAPYPFGPGATSYTDADPGLRADVDAVRQQVEATQGAASYQAFSAAANQAATDAQAEIAARQVGLDGASDQGVIP